MPSGEKIEAIFASLRSLAVACQWGLFEMRGIDLFAAIATLERERDEATAKADSERRQREALQLQLDSLNAALKEGADAEAELATANKLLAKFRGGVCTGDALLAEDSGRQKNGVGESWTITAAKDEKETRT